MELEFSLVFFLLLLLIAIIILIWIRFQRIINKKEIEIEKLKNIEEEKHEAIEKFTLLSKDHEELSKTSRNLKFQLIKTAKRSHDLNKIVSTLHHKILHLKEKEQTKNIPLNDVLRILNKPVQETQDSFQIHIDDINQQYIQQLKKFYPKLTMYDLRLCTYIKTGLSTREIAEMMNVLPSSINVSRSRLRKKLSLQSKDDLYTFLNNVV